MTISEGGFFMFRTMVYHRKKNLGGFYDLCGASPGTCGGGFCTLWERSLNIIQKSR